MTADMSSCNGGCLEAEIGSTEEKPYKGAAEDKELLRRIMMSKDGEVVSLYMEKHAHRNRILRSYTLTRKQTLAQRIRKWLKRLKDGSYSLLRSDHRRSRVGDPSWLPMQNCVRSTS